MMNNIKNLRKIKNERLKTLSELSQSSVWIEILRPKLEVLRAKDTATPSKDQWEAASREVERGATARLIKEIIRFVEEADNKLSKEYGHS